MILILSIADDIHSDHLSKLSARILQLWSDYFSFGNSVSLGGSTLNYVVITFVTRLSADC